MPDVHEERVRFANTVPDVYEKQASIANTVSDVHVEQVSATNKLSVHPEQDRVAITAPAQDSDMNAESEQD